MKSKDHVIKKHTGQNRGSASIESIATLVLLILAGICLFTLSISSTSAYGRLYDGKEASGQARVALSFINMKIRQNDVSGGVEIKPNPVNGRNALVVHEAYNGQRYDTWIYWDDGKLLEALVLEGEPPSREVSLEIIAVEGFEVGYQDENAIHTRVISRKGQKEYSYESLTTLRCSQGG
jgi:hypothetical protein